MTQAKKGEKTLFLSIYHYFFHLCELSLYSATTVCFIQLCRGFDFLVPLTFPDDEYAIRQADLLLTRIKSLFVHIQWVKARRQECAESVENVQHWLKMWDDRERLKCCAVSHKEGYLISLGTSYLNDIVWLNEIWTDIKARYSIKISSYWKAKEDDLFKFSLMENNNFKFIQRLLHLEITPYF